MTKEPSPPPRSLFPATDVPLAERMRPKTLDGFVGQQPIMGPSAPLRKLIERDRLISMIFWGDPGSGKTTLARIIAARAGGEFMALSAVSSGVGDVRRIIDRAASGRAIGKRTVLFIDEIHRFNKAQQDALLHAVEDGTLVLIGATTENPSFEVISPLLSRCKVFRFERLTPEDIGQVIDSALAGDGYLKNLKIVLDPEAREALIRHSGGDARIALNTLEMAVEISATDAPLDHLSHSDTITHYTDEQTNRPTKEPPHGSTAAPPHETSLQITVAAIEHALMSRRGRYDKKGEYHYDVISAFIKSMRGSDPDAAVYWLLRMLDAGEDPKFIARRMVILASEDIGNANPTALLLAQACADAVHFIGMPEAQLTLSQTALYLASSPKSNSSLAALLEAMKDVREDPERPVPLHLRNAVTGLMRQLEYGKDYKYAHEFEGGFTEQSHLPEGLQDRIYYKPSERGAEKAMGERLKNWWKKRREE